MANTGKESVGHGFEYSETTILTSASESLEKHPIPPSREADELSKNTQLRRTHAAKSFKN